MSRVDNFINKIDSSQGTRNNLMVVGGATLIFAVLLIGAAVAHQQGAILKGFTSPVADWTGIGVGAGLVVFVGGGGGTIAVLIRKKREQEAAEEAKKTAEEAKKAAEQAESEQTEKDTAAANRIIEEGF